MTMKTNPALPPVPVFPTSHAIRTVGTVWLLILCLSLPAWGLEITDDFNDGNDDGWTRLDSLASAVDLGLVPQPIAPPVEWTFPDGGYRILAAAPVIGDLGPARAFSYRGDATLTRFYVSVDLLDWRDDLDQACGFLVRASNVMLGSTTGYVVNYNSRQDIGDEPRGEFQINKVTGEAEDGTLAAAEIKLQPGRSYRMAALFDGTSLEGFIYDLEDLSHPVTHIAGEDGSYPSGHVGLFCFYRGDNETDSANISDVTFDNFHMTDDVERARGFLPGTSIESLGGIDVVQKSPASGATHHSADQGLTINLSIEESTPDDPSTEQGFKLWLNGQDVSSQLQIAKTPPAVGGAGSGLYNFQVDFGGLEPNRPYQATLQVLDLQSGSEIPKLSHVWHFDTFTDAFPQAGEGLVIEMENYNFGSLTCDFDPGSEPEAGGGFIDHPPLTSSSDEGFPIPDGVQGYAHTTGKRDVDYFDFHNPLEPAGDDSYYRVCDGVGFRFTQDAVRSQYLAADLRDNEIYRTEAGEWWNYTRTIPTGSWQAWLRVASRAEQVIRLDRIVSDPTQADQQTATLGQFQIPNTVTSSEFRFVPLTDTNGGIVNLDMEGETTLRLTVDGEPQNLDQKYTLFLNYLVLLPAGNEPVAPFDLTGAGVVGDQIQFSFPTQSGIQYSVLFKGDLNEPVWQTLEDFTGDGGEHAVTDTLTDAAKIYQVRAE